MSRSLALACVLAVLGPTSAWSMPEGRFATVDGSARVAVQRVADGALRVEIEAERFGAALVVSLAPRPGGLVFEEPAAPVGWVDRLMSRRAERLPFEGRRLAWATRIDDALVVTTLQVDPAGHPDLRRAHLMVVEDDTLRVDLWRYTDMDALGGPPLLLERQAP